MNTKNTTTPPTDERSPTLEERRELLALLAIDGLAFADNFGDGGTEAKLDAVSFVLQAIATELAAVSIRLETEVDPALQALGAMVGGLFGIGNNRR